MTNLVKADPKTTLTRLRKLLDVEPYLISLSSGMLYEEQVKYPTWNFNNAKFFGTKDGIEVLHMTDLQLGHIYCNMPKVISYINWVLKEPYRFVLLGGDLVDAWTAFSPGMPWDQICDPQGQVFKVCELLRPLRPRILGYVGGNHERRGLKSFGDLGLLIASILQIPYSNGQQFINIRYRKHEDFRFFLWHGRGAARTPGAKMQMIYYAMRELSGGSHVTLVGHLHQAMMLWSTYRVHERDRIVDRKIVGAMSSSFLEYFGTYAEVAGMSPSDIIMAKTVLEPNGKWELVLR